MKCFVNDADGAVGLDILARDDLGRWLDTIPDHQSRWVRSHDPGTSGMRHLVVPDTDGHVARVLVIADEPVGMRSLAGLPVHLPASMACRLADDVDGDTATALALGWALGSYHFGRYRSSDRNTARLVFPGQADRAEVEAVARAIWLGRDLINTPAEDLGPEELAGEVAKLAERHRGELTTVVGDDLLEQDYPSIHAVGRASSRQPRLVDMSWGDPGAYRVTLVGKGVCFDSGGLDIKSSGGMLLMKKDMGGAATAIALASMIMDLDLPVRLRLIVPAVDNAISGNAFRPLDVFRTRKGLTIEIGNTDAEGRVILCDALAEASSSGTDLLVDFATLTGAARVALGPDLPALFCNDGSLARDIADDCWRVGDPVWRLPLWSGYASDISSDVADLRTTGSTPFAGAITAALFLEKFVDKTTPWAHIDLMGWNRCHRPGRPKGGEVMAARGLLETIRARSTRLREAS